MVRTLAIASGLLPPEQDKYSYGRQILYRACIVKRNLITQYFCYFVIRENNICDIKKDNESSSSSHPASVRDESGCEI